MRRLIHSGMSIAIALAAFSAGASAQHEGHANMSDSAAVAAVVSKYHDALAAGDSVAALALLADDAVILETGGVETRAEYRSHHLPGDINFAKAIRSQRGPVHVRIRGDVAWSTGTSTTQGEMNGRTINSTGAELMVLVRTAQGWKISAIHWSSRQRRAG
jgi:ketosteroid isomerase-like protein